MRILTGDLKGRPIPFESGTQLRATSDKVREALVNILKAKLADSVVLDLFSGTGAMGFEALSNGAKQVVFIEKHNKQFTQLHSSVKALRVDDERTRVLGLDVYRALDGLNQKFDIIFADPPYTENHQDKLLASIAKNELLAEDGLIVFETTKTTSAADSGSFILISEKIYGDTRILIYR